MTVTNVGNGMARNTQFRVRFDRGLRHPKAQPGEYEIVSESTFDLPPNESKTMALSYEVVAGGNQCQEVTVTAQGVEPVRATGCVTGSQAVMAVTATGPRTHIVDEVAEFRATIQNNGDVEAKNVELVGALRPALEPAEAEEGHRAASRWRHRVPHPQPRCGRLARIQHDGPLPHAEQQCVHAICRNGRWRSAGGERGVRRDLAAAATGQSNRRGRPRFANFDRSIGESLRTGQKFPLTLNLLNAGQQAIGPVELRVILPPELTADATQIQPEGQVIVQGQMVAFAPFPQLAVQESRRYVIPVTAGTTGEVRVYASARVGIAGGESALVNAEPIVVRIIPQ